MAKENGLLYGVAMYDVARPPGSDWRWYTVWTAMLARCYNDRCQAKHPTYSGCSVCPEWLVASNFKAWFELHERGPAWHLDKDIITHGNKVYGPGTCCFIPRVLNNLFNDHARRRGVYPQGVTRNPQRRKYTVRCNVSKEVYLGTFTSLEEATKAYRDYKHRHCITVISELLSKGEITQAVAEAANRKTDILFRNNNA